MTLQTGLRAPPAIDSQLCFALYSTLHAVGQVYAEVLPNLELTYPQYLVMLVLWEADGLNVKQIGFRTHLDSGTLTPLLKRLERAGLVTRGRDAVDERQVRIGLTSKGSALREKAQTLPAYMADAMGRSPADLAVLKDSLLSLRDRLLVGRHAAQSPVA